jgi:hypothetical protein
MFLVPEITREREKKTGFSKKEKNFDSIICKIIEELIKTNVSRTGSVSFLR